MGFILFLTEITKRTERQDFGIYGKISAGRCSFLFVETGLFFWIETLSAIQSNARPHGLGGPLREAVFQGGKNAAVDSPTGFR